MRPPGQVEPNMSFSLHCRMVRGLLLQLPLWLLAATPALAQRLPTTVTPRHYDLAFVVDLSRARFLGTEAIELEIAEPTSRVVLNAAEIDFDTVTVGSGALAQRASVSVDGVNETATFTFPMALPRGAADIHITYSGTLNSQLRGFYLGNGGGRRYAVTQFESTDA